MKNTLFILLILSLLSCKKDSKIKTTKQEYIQTVDTVYCDSISKLKIDTLSMYNSQYVSIINIHPQKDKKIIVIKGKKVEVCYQNEISILLLKDKDTVYNLKLDIDTIFKNTKYDEIMLRKEFQNLKLETATVGFARARYLYYSYRFTGYPTITNYVNTFVIEYFGKHKGVLKNEYTRLFNNFLINQTIEEINKKFEEPIAQETFILDESLSEFRGNLTHFFSKEEYVKDSILIKEVTWKVNKDDNLIVYP